jgi:hypothetical protein
VVDSEEQRLAWVRSSEPPIRPTRERPASAPHWDGRCSGREVSIATAATVDDAVDSMRSWLEDFIASSARNDSRKQPHNTPANARVTPLGQGRGNGVDLRRQGGGPMSIETESRPSGSDIETPGRAFGIDAERRGQVRSGRIGKQ